MTTEFLSLGFAAVDWIEHYLVHGPGDVQGEPIELDDEFAAFVVKAGRVDPAGQRIVRRAFLSRSKGRAKSELAAMIECYEALGPCRFDHWAEPGEVSDWGYEYEPGEPVGAPLVYVEILNVATEESQAGNTYDNVFYMLNPETCSPELLADYGRIDVGLTRINLPNRRGSIEPVTASNESKDGGKSTFIVADETHLWTPPATGKFTLGKMHQTMVRNLLKRKVASGWMLETSTMYAEGEKSVAEGTHAYATSPAGRSGKLLFDHKQASESWDISKRGERIKALREAYGPAAAWMDLAAIADYYDDPQASEADFRRFWLNQPVPTVEPELDVFEGHWPGCLTDEKPPHEGIAFGVARSIDQAWLSLGSAVRDGEVWHVGPVRRDRGSSWLTSQIRELLAEFPSARFVIAGTGPASSLIPDLTEEFGEDTILVASNAELCDACGQMYDRVLDHSVRHRGYPELDDAISDAQWRTVGDRRAFGRKTSDVGMLEAVALGMWGLGQEVDLEPSAFWL